MTFYFGTGLLRSLEDYYLERLYKAIERQFQSNGSAYHWLYEELAVRVKVIRQSILFCDSLPPFIMLESTDELLEQVMNFTSSLFTEQKYGVAALNDSFYNEQNPYWDQFQEATALLKSEYQARELPLLYIDLSECVVRAVRMYLYIREHGIRSIDRDKFSGLIGLML